jgi:cob(I)alamin adenosyltransferase
MSVRFYTGRGDDGSTDLLGARVEKDDLRIEALGALDEATSAIGLGRALAESDQIQAVLMESQRDLYRVMAELAFTPDIRPESFVFAQERVAWVEAQTDGLSARLELPREFVLPGQSVAGAALDVARTIVRRAERRVVSLRHAGHDVNDAVLGYLNRLSSLLFIAARTEDHASGSAPQRAKTR